MQGFNFSDRVRRALQRARENATRSQHDYVAPEHMLLGILAEDDGVATEILENLKVDKDAVRGATTSALPPGTAGEFGPDLPYTSRAKRSLELAMLESRELGHFYVGTEHVLLGILREEQNGAAAALRTAGVSLEAARAEAVRLLGTPVRGQEAEMPGSEHVRMFVADANVARRAMLIATLALGVAIVSLAIALSR